MASNRLDKFIAKIVSEDERVLYSARVHPMFRILQILGITFIGIEHDLYRFSGERQPRLYLVTDQRVILIQGIVELIFFEVPLDMITDFRVGNSFLRAIFPYGSLALKLTDRKQMYELRGVVDPAALEKAIGNARWHYEHNAVRTA